MDTQIQSDYLVDTSSETSGNRRFVRSVFASAIQTAFSSFGVLAVTLASSILLSRGLLPQGKGLLTGLTLWSGLVFGLIDVSIGKVSTYQWGRATDEDKGKVLFGLLALAAATGLIGVLSLECVVPLAVGAHYSSRQMDVAQLYFLTTGMGPFAEVASGVLTAEGKFGLQNVMRILTPGVYTSCYLVLWSIGRMTVASCLEVLGVVSFVGSIPLMWAIFPFIRKLSRPDWGIFKSGFWYGFKGHIGNVANSLGGNALQSVVFLGLAPRDLALFNTAISAAGLAWVFPSAVALTSFPSMLGKSEEDVHRLVTQTIRKALAATVIINVFMSATIPFLIPFLFGSLYLGAIVPAEVFLALALVTGPSLLLGNALDSTGRTLQGSVASVVNYSISLAGTFLTVGNFGLMGATLSTVVGQIAGLSVRVIWYHRTITRVNLLEMVPTVHDFIEVLDHSAKAIRAKVSRTSKIARGEG